MISLRNIRKSFGNLEVLKGIDLDIQQGEMVSIVGPSGAGKTTLLQIMGTLDRPNEGSLRIADTDVTRLSSSALAHFRNAHIGFIFQFHQLLPEFTALENVMMPALIAGTSKRATKERAEELLDYMGLADRAAHKPAALSGGEKQRVAIGRALLTAPELLLMDEPTNGLDIPSKSEFRRVLAQYTSDEQTIIISTHQVRDLEQIIDSVLVLEQGEIICQATVSEVASRLRFAPVQPGETTQPLYTEQSPLGLLGVFARGEDEEAEDFSMELFFNALLAARPAVLSALQSQDLPK